MSRPPIVHKVVSGKLALEAKAHLVLSKFHFLKK